MQEVREEKNLGILIDDRLKFHKQTAAVFSKASQMLVVLQHSFASLNESTLLLLYWSVVRQFLEYGNAIWYPFGKANQKCLEQMQ